MNLHVLGSRDVTINKTGKHSVQITEFSLYQTPTKVTREILQSSDKAQAYRNWVNSLREEIQETIYADDDFFKEGEIVGYKTVCYEDEHLKDFDAFIKKCEEEGYELEFYEL
jgi:hypothetical protein